MDMGNDLRSLKDVLLPGRNHLPMPFLLKQRTISMDEGYLHSLLASWRGKTDLDKAMIIGSAMSQGTTLTFTVDFSEQRQKELGEDLSKALRRLRNQLSAVSSMGPTMVALEHTKSGRLHLHGMVMTTQSESFLKDALWALGGVPHSLPFRNLNQVNIKPATNALCWAMYMTKEMLRMPSEDSGKLIYASQSAKRLGRDHLDELVSLAEQKLGVTPDLRGRAAVYSRKATRRISKRATTH